LIKEPGNPELAGYEKWYNQLVASLRVIIEHTIVGIKIIRIVRYKIQSYKEKLRDQDMLIAGILYRLGDL